MNWLSPISSQSVVSLVVWVPAREMAVWWVDKLGQKLVRPESLSPPGHQPCFLKTFTDVLKMITLAMNCPSLGKGLRWGLYLFPWTYSQPDLALAQRLLSWCLREALQSFLRHLLLGQMWPRTSCCHFLPKGMQVLVLPAFLPPDRAVYLNSTPSRAAPSWGQVLLGAHVWLCAEFSEGGCSPGWWASRTCTVS